MRESRSPRVPRMLSIGDVAEAMNASTRTIRRWIADGDLHAHRMGRLVRVSEDDLVAFAATRRR
ncbi:MAG TPA: helix-turn-helix domain-containing protein [Caulobacteraceae bacterium]